MFAREGFGATVRTIAEAAGVSPGLVIHHFGSKEALRAECDDHVLALTRQANAAKLASDPNGSVLGALMGRMDVLEEDGPRIVYLIRSVQAGGQMARDLLDHLAVDVEKTVRDGVASGAIRPSLDEAARARYLVSYSMGTLLVDITMHPPDDWSDVGAILRAYVDRVVVPATEMAVHGIMTDPTLLDAVVSYQEDRR
ncbi:putative TetR family transcriptional regulator [Gordonia soli NBRC 108243]|uniref:Putative TetR family transcriptional regulator n=1 Tax=Gordonia soli NBRC 108243 TaxID=1223545 RepID=M0QI43_9ACTN|nr:putative TetR family transcriptional regulator [Gordonia soli NBRC 108243]